MRHLTVSNTGHPWSHSEVYAAAVPSSDAVNHVGLQIALGMTSIRLAAYI